MEKNARRRKIKATFAGVLFCMISGCVFCAELVGSPEQAGPPALLIRRTADDVALDLERVRAGGGCTVEWTDDLLSRAWFTSPGMPVIGTDGWRDVGVLGSAVKQRFYRVLDGRSSPLIIPPVGFVKVDVVRNGLTMVSVALIPKDNRLNGEEGCIGDMISMNLIGGIGASSADMIWKWDAFTQSYRTAFLIDGWGAGYDGRWWDDATADFSQLTFDLGEACWVMRRDTGPESVWIAFLGHVPLERSMTLWFVKGLTMFNWPYPTTLALNESTLGEAGNGGAGASSADMVWKWDADTQSYQRAFLVAGWGAGYDGKWWDDKTGTFSTIEFWPATAMWYLRRSDAPFAWFCVRPYDWFW